MYPTNELRIRPVYATVHGHTWTSAQPQAQPNRTQVMPAIAEEPPVGRVLAGGPTPPAWAGLGGRPRPGNVYTRREHRWLRRTLRTAGKWTLIALGAVAALAVAAVVFLAAGGAALLWMPL